MKPLLLSLVLLSACTKAPEPVAEKKVAFFTPDPATASLVTGRVRLAGGPRTAKRISMDAEEACQAMHPGGAYDESLRLSKGNDVLGAFVYIKSGLEGKSFAPPETGVELVQKGCQFVPRVLALRKGQTLKVKNADPVSHNIHPQPQNNREWNQQQSPGAPDLERRFGFPEVMIPIKCNVHSWMRSNLAVMEHPYFDVTGGLGRFRLVSLPPGNYVVAVWHEKLGELTKPLVLTGKSELNLDFEYPEK